jgi:hypothetical protein
MINKVSYNTTYVLLCDTIGKQRHIKGELLWHLWQKFEQN